MGYRCNVLLLISCRSLCLPSLDWTDSDKQGTGHVGLGPIEGAAKSSAALQFGRPMPGATGPKR